MSIAADSERATPKFWLGTAVSQAKACLNAWQNIAEWGELGREAAGAYPQYPSARRKLVQFLKKPSKTKWIEGEDILFALQGKNRNFLIPNRTEVERAQRGGWYYSNFYGNDPKKAVAQMDQYEEQFVLKAASGFLFELGLVELGYSKSDEKLNDWFALRLTPLGCAVIQGKRLEETKRDGGQIILQPNFQILAMGPVSLHLLAQLDLFAERKKAGETVFEYLLTRESVYSAQQRDMSVADVVGFLDKETLTDIPQNVRRSLQEWGAHHDRIVFRTGVTLMQTANSELLQQLMAHKHVGQYVAREAGTAVALVEMGKEKKLTLALQADDKLVARSGADPSAADNSVTIQTDGLIQSVHAVPSLHLQGRVTRFTEPAEMGWKLTEKSVAQAAGDKEKTNVILAELKKLNRGRLSLELVAKVKAWGGYYGAATVGTYTLVEFRDRKTLKELLKAKGLKGKLRPFSAGERALAMVEAGELTAVRAVLAELGVAVSDVA
ncbi:MAG: helicase-associated domain-containing protein [Chloroflexota bacterium]